MPQSKKHECIKEASLVKLLISGFPLYPLFSPVSWGCYHNHPSALSNACRKDLERLGGNQKATDATTPGSEEKKENCRWRGRYWDDPAG